MALVQTSSDEKPSEGGGAVADPVVRQIGPAGSQLRAAHALPADQLAQSGNGNARRSPMQTYQQRQQMVAAGNNNQLLAPQSNGLYSPSGLPHGFMSSFLLGEKEKMQAAAMRQLVAAATTANADSVQRAPQQAATGQLTANNNNNNQQQQHPNSNPANPNELAHKLVGPFGGAGLMPNMMFPYGRMPDNAIGQAYGAAVGQALPLESGTSSAGGATRRLAET